MTEPERWDAIVVGAGMGGAHVAAALAEAGLSVAVIEAGMPAASLSPPTRRAKLAALLLGRPLRRHGRWPQPLAVHDPARPGGRARHVPPVLGHGPGGSAALYGAALSRLRRIDVEEDIRADPEALGNAWPVDWDTLSADYARGEDRLGVVGGRDPGDPDLAAARPLGAPPPVGPRDRNIAEDLAANGAAPFRLPVGIAYRPGCTECQGRPCLRGCKAEGMSRALAAHVAAGRVRLVTGATVHRILPAAGGFAVDLGPGRDGLRAARVVLAAGALNTPRILHRSDALWGGAGPPALLGAGLMFHLSDLFAVFDRRGGAVRGPRKTTCVRDFYRDGGVPLGEIQSLGIDVAPGQIAGYLEDELAGRGLGRVPGLALATRLAGRLVAPRFAGAALFATILEDLPLTRNRVLPDGPGGAEGPIGIAYAPSAELAARAARFRACVRAAFAPNRVVFLSRPCRPNWGHPMGTCRMSDDPALGVTDRTGQVHGVPGLYVADAALFPSSGGTNPSLTVAALAAGVARAVAARG